MARKYIKKLPFWFIGLMIFVLSLSAISWTRSSFNRENYSDTTLKNVVSIKDVTSAAVLFELYINTVYSTAGLEKSALNLDVFRKAVTGYYNFRHFNMLSSAKSVITIVDFNKSSREKRLWIVDLTNSKLLYNTLVAHGQGSGNDMAQNFSNVTNSHQSSLGFYITDDTYSGKHGLSLTLNGMDKGFNTNAKERAIVVHGADYVSQEFINQHGRLGRSHGCPALPANLTSEIIKLIKGKTMLYINGPSSTYSSIYMEEKVVLENFTPHRSLMQVSL